MKWLIPLLLLAACTTSTSLEVPENFHCNEPYIQKGAECCLDQNSNAICDEDEVEESEPEITIEPVVEETVEVPEEKPEFLDEEITVVLGLEFGNTEPKKIEVDEMARSIIIQDIRQRNELRVGEMWIIFKEVNEEFIRMDIHDYALDRYVYSGSLYFPADRTCMDTHIGEYCLSYYQNSPTTLRWIRT